MLKMETACLRIKFTPLLQKNPKNSSKCCLEIVPEVSCIQNLDKLTWRQETNFIEYTIPMTYKVILKKRHAMKDLSDEVVKTYHSCVDLLLSSSKSTLNIGSGDVSKIISDTFILSKTIANCISKENMRSIVDDGGKTSEVVRNYYPLSHKTTNTSLQVIEVESKEAKENVEDGKVETNVQQNIESEMIDKTSLDKITNTDDYPIFTDTIQCGNAVIHMVPERTSMKPEDKRRLSLSPICSISTQETPFVTKDVASKAITCKIYDSQKDLVPLGNISEPSNLSNENQNSHAFPMIIDTSGRSSPKRLKCRVRVPPEIRISEYMQYMEKEVLPLKLMLNEIFSKCSALGITFSKKSSRQSLMCNSTSTYSILRSQEISKSNRVVYSIVFDG